MSEIVAASAAAFALYYVLKQRTLACGGGRLDEAPSIAEACRDVERPPNTWLEALYYFKEVFRYMYTETLGRWHTVDLFVGLAYLSHRQTPDYPAADIAKKGVAISTELLPHARIRLVEELQEYRRYMLYCRGLKFKRAEAQARAWIDTTGIRAEHILVQQSTAGLLRPAYVVIRDESLKAIVLCIRGTQSMKDLFTSLTGATKPHHVLTEQGLILGYSHLGMLAGARWLLRQVAPQLKAALAAAGPDYCLRIVGHSMGGGTAVMLTMMLRDLGPEFAEARCVAIACPACMTLQLAQGCSSFVTTIINGTDIVPTFSSATVDSLREDVTASSWFAEFQLDLRASVLRALQGGLIGVGSATRWTTNVLRPAVVAPFRACYGGARAASTTSLPSCTPACTPAWTSGQAGKAHPPTASTSHPSSDPAGWVGVKEASGPDALAGVGRRGPPAAACPTADSTAAAAAAAWPHTQLDEAAMADTLRSCLYAAGAHPPPSLTSALAASSSSSQGMSSSLSHAASAPSLAASWAGVRPGEVSGGGRVGVLPGQGGRAGVPGAGGAPSGGPGGGEGGGPAVVRGMRAVLQPMQRALASAWQEAGSSFLSPSIPPRPSSRASSGRGGGEEAELQPLLRGDDRKESGCWTEGRAQAGGAAGGSAQGLAGSGRGQPGGCLQPQGSGSSVTMTQQADGGAQGGGQLSSVQQQQGQQGQQQQLRRRPWTWVMGLANSEQQGLQQPLESQGPANQQDLADQQDPDDSPKKRQSIAATGTGSAAAAAASSTLAWWPLWATTPSTLPASKPPPTTSTQPPNCQGGLGRRAEQEDGGSPPQAPSPFAAQDHQGQEQQGTHSAANLGTALKSEAGPGPGAGAAAGAGLPASQRAVSSVGQWLVRGLWGLSAPSAPTPAVLPSPTASDEQQQRVPGHGQAGWVSPPHPAPPLASLRLRPRACEGSPPPRSEQQQQQQQVQQVQQQRELEAEEEEEEEEEDGDTDLPRPLLSALPHPAQASPRGLPTYSDALGAEGEVVGRQLEAGITAVVAAVTGDPRRAAPGSSEAAQAEAQAAAEAEAVLQEAEGEGLGGARAMGLGAGGGSWAPQGQHQAAPLLPTSYGAASGPDPRAVLTAPDIACLPIPRGPEEEAAAAAAAAAQEGQGSRSKRTNLYPAGRVLHFFPVSALPDLPQGMWQAGELSWQQQQGVRGAAAGIGQTGKHRAAEAGECQDRPAGEISEPSAAAARAGEAAGRGPAGQSAARQQLQSDMLLPDPVEPHTLPPAAAAPAAGIAAGDGDGASAAGGAGVGAGAGGIGGHVGEPWVLMEVGDHTAYGRVKLCKSMVMDHFMSAYLLALDSVALQLQQQ